MIERISNGLVGLFMFFSSWFSPGSDSQDIKIAAVKEISLGYSLQCIIKINWNEQMSDLIDAGIPLRFLITSYSDIGDTMQLIRTLDCDVSTYNYVFCDSIIVPKTDSIYISRKYSQIYRAIRSYSRWTCTFSQNANRFHIEAKLLPSRVSQLNRNIDMSEICGCRKYSRDFFRKSK